MWNTGTGLASRKAELISPQNLSQKTFSFQHSRKICKSKAASLHQQRLKAAHYLSGGDKLICKITSDRALQSMIEKAVSLVQRGLRDHDNNVQQINSRLLLLRNCDYILYLVRYCIGVTNLWWSQFLQVKFQVVISALVPFQITIQFQFAYTNKSKDERLCKTGPVFKPTEGLVHFQLLVHLF